MENWECLMNGQDGRTRLQHSVDLREQHLLSEVCLFAGSRAALQDVHDVLAKVEYGLGARR
jgi:hypothetical protein